MSKKPLPVRQFMNETAWLSCGIWGGDVSMCSHGAVPKRLLRSTIGSQSVLVSAHSVLRSAVRVASFLARF